MVRNRIVTLTDPVKSEVVKKNMADKAADVAGADEASDKLTGEVVRRY